MTGTQKLAAGVGGVMVAAGVGGFLLWRARRKAALAPKTPSETGNPPVYYASVRKNSLDEEIGGGWVLLDARDVRDPRIDTDKDVHVGHTVFLMLEHGGPAKVFPVKVLGISGDDFTGQWIGDAPPGGPQMIDFRGGHIFDYH